ncbi:MAG: hypothetical protein JW754_02910 [Candidatus Aenigmarchaeota archaeon]|nr:hypothetical protein [Candidatus Aenigmarchaeota archaeon]
MFKKILFALVLAVMLAPVVSAQTYNMDVSLSTEFVSVCPCTPVTEVQVDVMNLDDIPHSYVIELEMPADWTGHPEMHSALDVTTVNAKKVLDPGESSEPMQIYVTPSCDTKPGIYEIKVKVSTTGQSTIKTFDVEVLPCHYVQIETEDRIQSCRGSDVDFTVALTNYGKIKENFDVSIRTSWGDVLFEGEKRIDSQDTEAMEFSILPPDLTGNFAVLVDVVSKDSYAKDSQSIPLGIINCYDFNADVKPSDGVVCLGKTTKYKLIIDNVGLEGDTYNIFVPDFVTPERESISLEPNEEGIIDLFVKPNVLGRKNFEVTISSQSLPAIKKNVQASIEGIECRDVAVVVYPTDQALCHGMEAEYEVVVKNTGTVDDMYELSSDLGTFEEGVVAVSPGEVKRVKLTVDTSALQPGEERELTVQAKSGEVQDRTTVDLFAKNCYSVDFRINPMERNVCVGDEILYEITVRNTGEFRDSYSLQIVKEVMEEFTLEPGEEITFQKVLNAFFPQDQTYEIPFRLVSAHVFEENVMKVAVRPNAECFAVDLRDSEVMEVDSDVGYGKAVRLKLTNTGERKDAYEVTLEGPEWTYLSSSDAVMDPEDMKEFYVYISPDYFVTSGTYTVTVKGASNYASDSYTFYITVESVWPENVTGQGEPEMTINITLPSAQIFAGELSADSVKVLVLALIVLVIIIILAVKFVMFVK